LRNIKALHPKLQKLITKLKDECEKKGLKIGISECLRTVEEQDELYSRGRTKKGNIVTNAKGSTYSSMHQWGIAFDVYRNDGKGIYDNSDGFFESVGSIGKTLGLEWGGSWKTLKDMPHFQLSDWGSNATILKQKYGTPEKFFKSWENDSMTAEEKELLNDLVKKVENLTKEKEKIYHYTNEIPDWARNTVQKLLDKGILKGESDDNLNLSEDMLRIIVINDRAGLYK